MKKNDNILILGILFIALVVLGIQLLHSANGTEKVKITVDGKVFGTYLLSEDRNEYSFNYGGYGFNGVR